jgi:hypothetical protein
MYLSFLRAIGAFCILSTFWSTIRLFDVSIFEWLAPGVILLALPYAVEKQGTSFSSLRLAVFGLLLLGLAGIVSAPGSYEPSEHLLKVIKLVGAFGMVIGVSYILANRKIFSVIEILYLLAFSAAACSAVAVLQGRGGILIGLIHRSGGAGVSITSWARMTGLAEHPIEAGLVAAYGVVISLGLGIATRKWLVLLPLIAIDIYSMRYSASLTAVFAFLLASMTMCIFARAYSVLLSGVAAGALVMSMAMAFSGDALGLLTSRVAALYEAQGNYVTVQSREMQLEKAIDLIDAKTLAVGNGYSAVDLPNNMEIHNGIVASVFHFGLLGFISQCLLIFFFVSRLGHDASRPLKSILVGCVVVFALSYLSGPPQARPSLWAPLIFLGAFLTTRNANAAASANSLLRPTGILKERIQ